MLFPSSESVEFAGEGGEEAHEVLHEDFVGFFCVVGVEDGDGAVVFFEELFEVGVSEAGESVFVGDVEGFGVVVCAGCFYELAESCAVFVESAGIVVVVVVGCSVVGGEFFELCFFGDVVFVACSGVEDFLGLGLWDAELLVFVVLEVVDGEYSLSCCGELVGDFSLVAPVA